MIHPLAILLLTALPAFALQSPRAASNGSVTPMAIAVVMSNPPPQLITLTLPTSWQILSSQDLSSQNWSRERLVAVTFTVTNNAPQKFFKLARTSSTAGLSWNHSTDAQVVGYKIYIGNESGGYTRCEDAGHANNLTLNLTGGKDYYFAATTYNAAGMESDFSAETKQRMEWDKP